MAPLLDRIRAQAQPDVRRQISVPEWGEEGEPLIIHYGMITLADLSSAQVLHPKEPFRQSVELLCMKAEDAAGQKLFKRMDAVWLMENADPAVLNRIFGELNKRPSAEELEKN